MRERERRGGDEHNFAIPRRGVDIAGPGGHRGAGKRGPAIGVGVARRTKRPKACADRHISMSNGEVAQRVLEGRVAPGGERHVTWLARVDAVGSVPGHRRGKTCAVVEHLAQRAVTHRIGRQLLWCAEISRIELSDCPAGIHLVKRREEIRIALDANIIDRTLSVDDRTEVAVARNRALDRHAAGVVVLRRALDAQCERKRRRDGGDESLRRIDSRLGNSYFAQPLC